MLSDAFDARLMHVQRHAEPEALGSVPQWVWLVFLVYVSTYLFEGAIRWGLGSVGLGALIYLRDPLMLLAIGRAVFVFAGGVWVSYRSVLLWIIFALVILLSTWFGPRVPQVLFGTKILIPLVFGVMYGSRFFGQLHRWRKYFLLLFLATGLGVLGDKFLTYPWEGLSLEIGGAQVSIGRVWYAGEWQRLSGFARASYDAAIFSIVLYIIYSAVVKSHWVRWFAFLFTAVVVLLTTTKGIILALAVVGGCEMFRARVLLWRAVVGIVGSVFVVLGITLPAVSMYVRPSLVFDSDVERLLLYSFFDRMANTWPDALSVIDSFWKFIFGSGIGSIGAAQAYFDFTNYNPADNVFVYVFVIVGFAGVALLAYSLLRALWAKNVGADSVAVKTVAVFVAVYGVTTNLIDNPVVGFCIGSLIGAALLGFGRIGKTPDG